MDPITKGFVKDIEGFCKDQGVDLVTFEKGQRKDDLAHEYLSRFEGDEGVLFVGKAQEKTTTFRTEKRKNPDTGKTYPWIVRATAMVNHYYFYCVDKDFGPFFIKFCSYFPAPRGALIYPPRSGVGLEVISQGEFKRSMQRQQDCSSLLLSASDGSVVASC